MRSTVTSSGNGRGCTVALLSAGTLLGALLTLRLVGLVLLLSVGSLQRLIVGRHLLVTLVIEAVAVRRVVSRVHHAVRRLSSRVLLSGRAGLRLGSVGLRSVRRRGGRGIFLANAGSDRRLLEGTLCLTSLLLLGVLLLVILVEAHVAKSILTVQS